MDDKYKDQRKDIKDFEDFIECLNKNAVKYCIVGAFAVAYHAQPRDTKDIDFLVENTRDNAKKILNALRDFGFGEVADQLSLEDIIKKNSIIQLGYEPNRIDIISSIANVEFAEVWKKKVEGKLGNIKAYFIGINELIKNKESAQDMRSTKLAKLKDLRDLEILKSVTKKNNL